MAETITNTITSTVTLTTGTTNPLTISDTGAIVTGAFYGVDGGSGIVGTVTNAGTVSAYGSGVILLGGGSVTNNGTASTITGTSRNGYGIRIRSLALLWHIGVDGFTDEHLTVRAP